MEIEGVIKGEWAGSVFCHADVLDVRIWCMENIEDTNNNSFFNYYGDNLCELYVRREKDYVLAQLRWA